MYPKLSLQEAVVVKDDNKNEVADIVPSNKAGYVARGNLSYTTHPGARKSQKPQKSLALAYLLWFFGGIFGLHLFYLGRDSQVFVYWWSLGGYLGAGIIRDFFKLPSYVRDANDDSTFLADLSEKMRKKKKPGFFSNIPRMTAQVMVGNMWYLLMDAAVPKEEFFGGYSIRPLAVFLAPLGAALAVWMIGNIGREQGKFQWAFIGAYSVVLTVPFFGLPILNWCSVVSMVLFNRLGRQWRRTPYAKASFAVRAAKLSVSSVAFWGLVISFLYFNATLTNNNEEIRFRDAVGNFIRSPMFQEFKGNAKKLYNDTWNEGFSQAWTNFIELMDPSGSIHALKTLELPKNATQAQIKERVRDLSKKWHPDKHVSVEEKKVAEKFFMEVQQAGDVLIDSKRRRVRNKKRFDSD